MKGATQHAVDPEVFLALEDLEMVGRGLAAAVSQGQHRSVNPGDGTEFHRHRMYQAGDDLRRLNWGLYARQRKLYIKESRLESLRPVYLLLDASGSMAVANGPWSKFDYAVRAAAGLAWLAEGQRDASALAILRNGLESVIAPGGGDPHFLEICANLAGAKAGGQGDLDKAMDEAELLCRKPGFVVLMSDFFDKEDALMMRMAALGARGHDVFALQVLDPVEVQLPAKGDFDFVDAESGDTLKASVEGLRQEHATAVAKWRADLRRAALDAGVRWQSAHTGEPIAPVLRAWLEGAL